MKKRILALTLAIVMIISVFSAMTISASAATYSVSVTTGNYSTLVNLGSNKLLNVYGNKNANNTNVTVYSKDKTSGQNFKFVKNGSGYTLIPQCATSRALNIYGNTAKSSSNVCIWSITNHSTQTWIPEYVSSYSAYILRSVYNKNLVLTAEGSANSSNVCVKTYSAGNKYQLWTCGALKPALNRTTTATTNTTTQSTSSNSWLWPSPTKKMSCGFADTNYHSSWHRGIDIPTAIGTNVYASKSGTVYIQSYNSARGYWMVIDHGDGYYSEYQHLKASSFKYKTGDKVKQGDIIALSGNTGVGTGPHLHFEIMYLGSSGLGAKYGSYYNSNAKFVNCNPKNVSKITGNFTIKVTTNSSVAKSSLTKSGSYISDTKGINYIFK